MFINQSGTIYTILNAITYNVTGDIFTTFLLIMLCLLFLGLALRIPLEFTSLLILPLLLIIMAYSGQYIQIGGIIVIYLSIVLAKNFFFN